MLHFFLVFLFLEHSHKLTPVNDRKGLRATNPTLVLQSKEASLVQLAWLSD